MANIESHDCKVCMKKILGTVNVFESHLKGKKHKKLIPAFLYVRGAFSKDDVPEIDKYFLRYGEIILHKFNETQNFIRYKFANPENHCKIIHSEPHKVNGIELDIQKTPSAVNVATSSEKKKKENEIANKKRALINSLAACTSFDDEAHLLRKQLQRNQRQDTEGRKIIFNDISNALRWANFKHFDIYFFGSSVTGLNVDGSDVDIYISFPPALGNVDERKLLQKLRSAIYASRKFCDILLISTCAVPIIKCIHSKTQICCDINIKNKLPVYNSQLIKFYADCDEKIATLMILIKYFMEHNGLKKPNCFSSYALYMMVIFYLQQEPYNLPSVRSMQLTVIPNIVSGWNCAFEPISTRSINEIMQKFTIYDLFTGFFHFYSYFDCFTFAICPFIGTTLKKVDLVPPYNLPEDYGQIELGMQVKQHGIMHVQDPFEHSRNVTSSTTPQTLAKFFLMCKKLSSALLDNKKTSLGTTIKSSMDFTYYKFLVPLIACDNCDVKNQLTLIDRILFKILTDIFKCEVKKLGADSTTVHYECNGFKNVWISRATIERQINLPHYSEDDMEVVISDTCLRTEVPGSTVVRFSMSLSDAEMGRNIFFKFTNKLSALLIHYIETKLPKWVPNHWSRERDLNDTTNDVVFVKPKEPIIVVISDDEAEAADKTEKADKNELALKRSDVDMLKEHKSEDAEPNVNKAISEEDVPSDFFDAFGNEDFLNAFVDVAMDHPILPAVEKITVESSEKEEGEIIDELLSLESTPKRKRSPSPKSTMRKTKKSKKSSKHKNDLLPSTIDKDDFDIKPWKVLKKDEADKDVSVKASKRKRQSSLDYESGKKVGCRRSASADSQNTKRRRSFLEEITEKTEQNNNYCDNGKETEKQKILYKLLAENKITLTEFLALSDRNPPQNKSGVIHRCQNAIQYLSSNVFPPRLNSMSKYQSESPQMPAVRFKYTTPGKADLNPTSEDYKENLKKLLTSLNIDCFHIDLDNEVPFLNKVLKSDAEVQCHEITLVSTGVQVNL